MAAINARAGCRAVATQKRELESYLHHEAICEAYADNQINITFPGPFADFDDVPSIVAQAVHAVQGTGQWASLDEEKRRKKESQAKKILNGMAVTKMNVTRLAQTDPNNEIRGWLNSIEAMAAAAEA